MRSGFVARRVAKDMTVEEFDAWCNATNKFDAVGEAADEVGGPRLSLVPLPEQNIPWPTDLLPPNPPPARLGDGEAQPVRGTGEHRTDQPQGGGGADAATSPIEATPFDGIPLESSRNRLAGWSAARQK